MALLTRVSLALAVVAGALALPAAAGAGVGLDPSASQQLREAVTAQTLRPYLERIEDISAHHGPAGTTAPDGHPADGHGEFRLAGTAGDEQTATYIEGVLDSAGYDAVKTHFDFPFFQETAPPHFERLAPTARVYAEGADFLTMEYSGSGDATGTVVPTNDIVIPPGPTASTSNSGCEASDFVPASGSEPQIALVQRGTCDFVVKAANAEAAGYDAVIIFNEGQPGRTATINGTLGGPSVTIPVLGASFAVGEELYNLAQAGPVQAHVTTTTVSETRQSHNVVASTAGGRSDRVVLAGAHTDSTVDGPAINDDGSGVALLLGTAKAFSDQGIAPRNQVRFGFWGAEESGLLGSANYAAGLTSAQRKSIAVNLAFDMLASDNYVRFVYDGNGSATGIKGPNGSGVVEDVFTSYFASQGMATDPTALDGRTDYASFTDIGIPAGGLFAGAEVAKTAEQAAEYGGTAGQPYYVCYHQACDTVATVYGDEGDVFSPTPPGDLAAFTNAGLGEQAYTELSGGAAHAVLSFAQTTASVNGTDKASDIAKLKASQEYQGGRLRH